MIAMDGSIPLIQMRWDVINHLINRYNYKSYLEVGYYKGWSFDRVGCERKTAVDPNPSKTPEMEALQNMGLIREDGSLIFKMTSDFFFKEIVSNTYDLIFIDGLHEANQVIKDVQNAAKHLNEGGRIVLHDMNPPKYENTTTGIEGCWTGDVYKTAALLEDFGEFYTVDIDFGVGVLDPEVEAQIIDYAHIELDPTGKWWDHFDKHRGEILNLISVEEFLEREKKPEEYVWPHQLGDDFM